MSLEIFIKCLRQGYTCRCFLLFFLAFLDPCFEKISYRGEGDKGNNFGCFQD